MVNLKVSLREDSATSRLRFQKDVVEDILKGGFQLRDSFLRRTTTYQGFFTLRNNFMITHGQVCLAGYLLGKFEFRYFEYLFINLFIS